MRSVKKARGPGPTLADAMPWLAGILAGMAYLSTRSHFFNFDGVACAIAVDLSDWAHLTHGNHLGYGVLGASFYKLWQAAGYQGRSLFTLQVLDSLLGAASVGVFCSLLTRVGMSPLIAALASGGLAFSYAWWFWSLEAQVYMLGSLFLVLAAREALSEEPCPVRTGLWQAAAILGHCGHLMFAPAALYLLQGRPGLDRRRAWTAYLLALTLPVVAAYVLAGLLAVRPGTLDEARVWLLGSAALSMDRSFVWFGGWSWDNLVAWMRMSLRVFSDFVEAPPSFQAFGLLLAAAPAACAAAGAWQRRDRLTRSALLWLAGYAVLYSSWQPGTIVYRVSDMPAFWLLIACAASAGPAAASRSGTVLLHSWKAMLLAGFVGAAGFFNWKALVEPWTHPSRNQSYQTALWLNKVVPENGWVACLNLDQVYVPYFGMRKPLNIRYFQDRREVLAERISDLDKAGEPVFVTSATLLLGDWGPFFRSYGLIERDKSPDGVVLFRVAKQWTKR